MPAPTALGHLGAVRGEDRRLGARRVVLGQLGDRLEQVRAEAVVEELGRDAGRRARRGPRARRRARRSASASQVWTKRGDLEFGHRAARRIVAKGAEPRTIPRDRPECSDAQQSAHRARPPRPAASVLGRALAVAVGRGAAVAIRRTAAPRRPAPGPPAGRCRRSTSSISPASPGASRRSPARSSSSTSGRPGASRAGSRCRRSTRWRRGAAARASSSPPSTTRSRRTSIRRFLERAPFKSPILLDSDGDATVDWTPRVFPSTVLIGRNGQPVHVVVGELDWEGAEAKALLDPLVAAPGRA